MSLDPLAQTVIYLYPTAVFSFVFQSSSYRFSFLVARPEKVSGFAFCRVFFPHQPSVILYRPHTEACPSSQLLFGRTSLRWPFALSRRKYALEIILFLICFIASFYTSLLSAGIAISLARLHKTCHLCVLCSQRQMDIACILGVRVVTSFHSISRCLC